MAVKFPQRVTSTTDEGDRWTVIQNNLDFLADLLDKFMGTLLKGSATVTNGNTTVAVSFPSTLLSPAVVVTPVADPVGRFWISGRTGAGFTINLSVAAPVAGIQFDWVAKGA